MRVLATLLGLLCLTQAAKFPKGWKSCQKSDPDVESCLTSAVQAAITDLTQNGKPSLGVFPLDPLHFDRVAINQGSGPVSINLDLSDLDANGLKSMIIKSAKPHWNGNYWSEMDIDYSFPTQINLVGKYKVSGKVLVLPVKGEGNCNLDLDQIYGKAKLKFSTVEKKGKTYYNLDSINFSFDTNKLTLNFQNLFNGDKALGNNMNNFLNDNWRDILQELKPAIAGAFGAAFKEIGNRVFSKVEANLISLP